MFELRAVELKTGDEFAVDSGDSWWKCVSRAGARVRARCVSSQDDAWHPGQEESFLFFASDRVIVR
jgi:hypothetical protein